MLAIFKSPKKVGENLLANQVLKSENAWKEFRSRVKDFLAAKEPALEVNLIKGVCFVPSTVSCSHLSLLKSNWLKNLDVLMSPRRVAKIPLTVATLWL